MSRFQFVADHQDAFEVKRLCELVEVERSSFYAWLNAAPVREARAAADQRRTYCVDRRHRPTPEQGRAVITAHFEPDARPVACRESGLIMRMTSQVGQPGNVTAAAHGSMDAALWAFPTVGGRRQRTPSRFTPTHWPHTEPGDLRPRLKGQRLPALVDLASRASFTATVVHG